MAEPKEETLEEMLMQYVMVKIDHVIPENLRLSFANHISIQHTPDGEFYVSFFQLEHPIIAGEAAEKIEAIKQLKEIKAVCVARIVLNEQKIPGFITHLGSMYENFLKRKSLLEKQKLELALETKEAL